MDTRSHLVPRKEVRSVISKFRTHTRNKQRDGEHYRLDRHHAEAYFMDMSGYRKLKEKVYSFLHSLREEGEPIVYVDVCGRATLGSADINYSFSLQPNQWEHDQIPKRVVGDLFSAKDFYGFLQMIKANGHRPSFVTCVPVAGLNTYAFGDKNLQRYEEVMYQRLENNLRAMITLLRPGGFIYLSEILQMDSLSEFFAHVPHEERKATIFVKNLCKSMRCSVYTEGWHGGTPDFLIRKWLR